MKHTWRAAFGVDAFLFLAASGNSSSSLVEPRKWHNVAAGAESAALTGLSWQKSPPETLGPPRMGGEKKMSWGKTLLLVVHQPFSGVWNFPLACVALWSRVWVVGVGWGRNFCKWVLIQWGEDKDPSPQSHVSIPLVGFQLTLGLTWYVCMHSLTLSSGRWQLKIN